MRFSRSSPKKLKTKTPKQRDKNHNATNKGQHKGKKNILVVHDGGAVSSHGLFFDDTDELESAAERSVKVGPFRALKMSHLQDVVILSHTQEKNVTPNNELDIKNVMLLGDDQTPPVVKGYRRVMLHVDIYIEYGYM